MDDELNGDDVLCKFLAAFDSTHPVAFVERVCAGEANFVAAGFYSRVAFSASADRALRGAASFSLYC